MTVTRTSGFSSRERATSSFARVMSADTVSWKTGACHAAVSRRAIVLRMFVSGMLSTSPDDRHRPAPAHPPGRRGEPAARSTSSATMRPVRPRALQRRKLDAALAGDPARERRRLDAAAVPAPALVRLGARGGAVPDGAARRTRRARARAPPRGRARSSSGVVAVRFGAPSARRRRSRAGDLLALLADPARSSGRPATSPVATRSSAARPTPSASTSWVTLSVSSS